MRHRSHRLGELCTITKGKSPITKTVPGPYPLVTTGEERKSADTYQFDGQAVCVPLVSSTGHGHASLKRVHYQSGKFALANIVAALEVNDPSVLSTKYLFRYLMHFKDQLIVPLLTGSANMSLSVARLAKVDVSLPSLAEQERIVRLLDETDTIRTLRAKADQRTADLIPALFHEMFGDPITNPMGWPTRRLPELCANDGGIKAGPFGSSLTKAMYTEVGPRVYGQEQVIADDFTVGDYHISEEKYREMAPYTVAPGDILISLVGTIGKLAIVPESIEPGIINPRLIRVRPNTSRLDPTFLIGVLRSASMVSHLERVATGGTMGVLNARILKGIDIPVPPVERQHAFAGRVHTLLSLMDQQKVSGNRLNESVRALTQRLL